MSGCRYNICAFDSLAYVFRERRWWYFKVVSVSNWDVELGVCFKKFDFVNS